MFRKCLCALVVCMGLILLALVPSPPTAAQTKPSLTPIEHLGKLLFFDTQLSKNANQSCATCHDPEVGFTGSDSAVNLHGAVYPGSDPTLFGNRKPSAAAYAGDSPPLRRGGASTGWAGGMFWDGRADGSTLGDPLAEQAKGPFLNPLEMGLGSPEELCAKVIAGTYAGLFAQVWGTGSPDCTKASAAYDQISKSIAAYERSNEVNPFSSKFDLFWDTAKSRRLDVTKISARNWTAYRSLGLTDPELYGLAVFTDPRGANCAACHSLKPGSKGYPLFTDYSYHNVGIPRNLENPFYRNLAHNPEGAAWVDTGLGGYLKEAQPQKGLQENGKMKVPTLRNVDKRPSAHVVKAYGHNGYFKSLPDIIQFYAARGMHGGMMHGGMMGGRMMGMGMMGAGMMHGRRMHGRRMFPAPEVDQNLAPLNMIHRHDQANILAFLKTLSDGYARRD